MRILLQPMVRQVGSRQV